MVWYLYVMLVSALVPPQVDALFPMSTHRRHDVSSTPTQSPPTLCDVPKLEECNKLAQYSSTLDKLVKFCAAFPLYKKCVDAASCSTEVAFKMALERAKGCFLLSTKARRGSITLSLLMSLTLLISGCSFSPSLYTYIYGKNSSSPTSPGTSTPSSAPSTDPCDLVDKDKYCELPADSKSSNRKAVEDHGCSVPVSITFAAYENVILWKT